MQDAEMTNDERHYLVGGGIASLAAAVFLIRDAGVSGDRIRIYEQLTVLGGSLDGGGDAEHGYLARGGRMFEKHFACTFDLLDSIPSADDPALSVKDDIMAFNDMVPGSSNCRLVRNGKPAEDRYDLTLSPLDILDINRLILHSEHGLGGRQIDDWFHPGFFDSNFWMMWSTMFSFQPWHSLIEMRRYLRRFIHLFPGFTRIAGILRTRYNQYDSLIAPIINWLQDRGVEFETGTTVTDLTITGDLSARQITGLTLSDGKTVAIRPQDRAYVTLGSMTDGSVLGDMDTAPPLDDSESGAWRLWRKLAAENSGFGRPEVFCGDTGKTAWHSFTVTLQGPEFFEFMEDFTGNRTGTGGLVTFASSGWTLSIVLFHQPHFRNQKKGLYTLWGYALRGDREGDFVRKPMWQASGKDILTELYGQLNLNAEQIAWFDNASVIPCRMPFITSQFMPRSSGDRPKLRPAGSQNFALLGQFVEQPRDCVFTVEYSVRSARMAVSQLTGRCDPPPPVAHTDRDPLVLMRAAKVLMGG
ncbi:oleate hydratase [Thalassovita sp.]|uniref:oleate hydratase n=1 Tax=Thalassovita sp. TaxID=1979401 RepID=UPI002B276240|nr:oleate hydratase [Thalassovita sp.]